MIKESVYVCHESVFTAPTPRPIFWHSIVVRKKRPVCCSWERDLDVKFHLESIDPVVMMETPSRPVMKTFPVREGDYLHYRPECIFSTYLARRWEFAIGSFSLWWKHFLHETGTVFITGWKSSLRCSWERDPWSRKQAGRHPPRDEKTGSCSHRPARCEQVRFSSRGGGISCAQLLQIWGMIWAAWCFTRVSAPFECGFGSFTFQQNSSSSPCDRQLDSVEI